ncbi:hypothetical protein Eta_0049 [Serratia phage Eta]|uniref:Uncharacterized protein n=1 Tax=Serratia phage Eta TaxID=1282995 RepID=R9VYK9_9CAUD|nr:hypothetical protein Eta_0049 [Serratia phage Eta]AGN89495.1 hypothetical protein Eta_0049 [Serratia phage Eta]
MAKKLKRIARMRVPLYGVEVIVCPTKQDAEKEMWAWVLSSNFMAQVTTGVDNKTGAECVAIIFRSLDDYCTETLTHECVHAAWRVLELVGVKSDVDNQEPLAYLTGWISRQVNNFMVSHIEAEESVSNGK